MIRSSFQYCGITVYDPDIIHCTKPTFECEAIRENLLNWKPQPVNNPVLFEETEQEQIGLDDQEMVDQDSELSEEIDLDLNDLILAD